MFFIKAIDNTFLFITFYLLQFLWFINIYVY